MNIAQKELAYRIFVTDTLKAIAKNSATLSRGGGEYPSMRFLDFINKVETPEDNRTQEEIIEQIRGSLRRLGDGNTA